MNNNAYKQTAATDNDLAQTPWFVIRQLQMLTGYNIMFDVCASPETAKAVFYWTEKHDALSQSWMQAMTYHRAATNDAMYMNPPFSKVDHWTYRASQEAMQGIVIIGCVKDAPDTDWYQDNVENEATVIYKPNSRLNFLKPDGTPFTHINKHGKVVKSGPNFPICFPVWTPLRTGQPAPIKRFKLNKEL